MPEVAVIVSAYDRPDQLRTCLSSFAAQTFRDFELLVTDNSDIGAIREEQERLVEFFHDPRLKYIHTGSILPVSDCYWSADYGVGITTGNWLVFPCDDCYYVPKFLKKMHDAAERDALDLVECNIVWDCAGRSPYAVMYTNPTLWHNNAKTSFLLRRSSYITPWPGKPPTSSMSNADQQLVWQVLQRGGKVGKVEEILVVQN